MDLPLESGRSRSRAEMRKGHFVPLHALELDGFIFPGTPHRNSTYTKTVLADSTVVYPTTFQPHCQPLFILTYYKVP
jgi:hypothetical protein